jgi:hypothetical protein
MVIYPLEKEHKTMWKSHDFQLKWWVFHIYVSLEEGSVFYTECERPIFQTLENNFLNYPPVYHIAINYVFISTEFYRFLWPFVGVFSGDIGMISQEISWATTLW